MNKNVLLKLCPTITGIVIHAHARITLSRFQNTKSTCALHAGRTVRAVRAPLVEESLQCRP